MIINDYCEIITGLIVAISVGLIAFLIMYFFYSLGEGQYKEIIEKCELKLTREQHCKIVAVPDIGSENIKR